MQGKKSNDLVLGVMVTNRALHAVLMRGTGDGIEILRRFSRQRVSRTTQGDLLTSVPELQEEASSTDFTIQFGDSGDNANNIFLSSEFGDAASNLKPDEDDLVSGGQVSTFVLELGDILAECKDAGYENPVLAFCADSSEVQHVELHISRDPKTAKEGKKQDRSSLIKSLEDQYQGGFDHDRVGFLGMSHSNASEERYLAVFPKQRDSVIATLVAIRDQPSSRVPSVRVLDAEVSLFVGLARHALTYSHPDSDPWEVGSSAGHTLVVRAGLEDTIVLFMEGMDLVHYESLRSLTAYESPETICSRVLLQQDEHGISEVDNVFLLSEEREEDLIESFEMFFPDSRLESLRAQIAEFGDVGMEDSNSSAIVGAAAAGMRLIKNERLDVIFDDINLMPKRLIKKRLRLPITWHFPALILLMGLTVLFFVYRYVNIEKEIDSYQERLRSYPADIMEADPRRLQARIDSFDTVTSSYLNALNVLDDLLLGSDQWSRTLEKVAAGTENVRSIWIDSWRPNGNELIITGNSTSRDRVVELAESVGAEIESLIFSEIREAEVYSFRMRMPLVIDLPEAARYLRQRVAEQNQSDSENELENESGNQNQP